ncbi:hypothetical protein [Gaiella sp.]|uniref:hypothetical protein n=1 Tax=Gaiella sp. TaxID=2663207 RepID=UPI003266D071
MEAKAGERVEDLAEVLAYHTGEALTLAEATGDTTLQATVTPRAARYALLAGERALGLDTDKALGLLDSARALTPDTDPSFPLVLLRWADADMQAGRQQRDAAAALAQAVGLFQAQGDLLHAGETLSLLSTVHWYLGESDSLALVEQAVALLEPSPGPGLVAAIAQVANNRMVSGAPREAVAAAERALTLSDQLGLSVPGRALGIRGLNRCTLGDLDGLTDTEQALRLLVADGKGRDAAVLMHNLAITRGYLEGPAAAVAAFEEACLFAQARGLTEMAQVASAISVGALVQAGRFDEALTQTDLLLPMLHASSNRLAEAELLVYHAVVLVERGQDASEPAEQALQIARDTGEPIHLANAVWGRVPALLATGDTAAARTLLDEVANAPTHDDPEFYARALTALARAAHTLDDPDLLARLAADVPDTLPVQQHALATVHAIQTEQAGDHAQAAVLHADAASRWEQFTAVLERAHALLAQGRCLTRTGDPAADQPLRRARDLFEQMGARPRLQECDTLISQASKLSS